MGGYIDIKKLTLDELAGVVNLYPWFGGARKELCERMSSMGGDSWGESQYADAAMYIGARGKLSDMMRSARKVDWTDSDVERLLKSYIAEKEDNKAQSPEVSEKRKVYAGVGDYFSQEDYDQVRRVDDNVFSRYAAKARQGKTAQDEGNDMEFDMYTETLAGIYLEQGYPEQAKRIYSKLILAYPEKNAYFAALIQKIDELNQY
ncbi:MAG: hypothetical protein IJZ70_04510 [Bacteroidales bacterium]|nr:hypothetical protein [Bacteroidales bacterium]